MINELIYVLQKKNIHCNFFHYSALLSVDDANWNNKLIHLHKVEEAFNVMWIYLFFHFCIFKKFYFVQRKMGKI